MREETGATVCLNAACEHRSHLLLPQAVTFRCMSPAGGIPPFHFWLQSRVSVSAAV